MKSKIALIAIMVMSSGLLIVSIFAVPSKNATYVGSSKCKKCHIKPFQTWQKTAHSRNFEILTMLKREKDPDCVKCHSTAYGEPSGFVNFATTPDLAGTTCEACHGPGSEHIVVNIEDKEKAKATISQPGGACVKCHNPHIIREDEVGKAALPVLKKKLQELQKKIEALEAE